MVILHNKCLGKCQKYENTNKNIQQFKYCLNTSTLKQTTGSWEQDGCNTTAYITQRDKIIAHFKIGELP